MNLTELRVLVNKKYSKFLAIPIAIILNIFCAELFVSILGLPLFMDSIWTFVVTAWYGPIIGIVVGFSHNIIYGILKNNFQIYWAFGFISIFYVIATDFYLKKNSLHSPTVFFYFAAFIEIIGSIFSAIISIFVYHGIPNTTLPIDAIVRMFMSAGFDIILASIIGRIFINFIDKGIAIFIMSVLYLWKNNKKLIYENYSE